MRDTQRDIKTKLKVFEYARNTKNISLTCRYFGVSRDTFYRWKKAYADHGKEGLFSSNPCPRNPTLRTPPHIEEKILYLRRTYHLGQVRISWYLERYHGNKISPAGVYNVLKRNDMNRLPRNARKRTVQTKRYEKQTGAIIFRLTSNFSHCDG